MSRKRDKLSGCKEKKRKSKKWKEIEKKRISKFSFFFELLVGALACVHFGFMHFDMQPDSEYYFRSIFRATQNSTRQYIIVF